MAPHNKNETLNKINKGFLLRFDKSEGYKEGIQNMSDSAVEIELWEHDQKADQMIRLYPKIVEEAGEEETS